MIKNQLKLNVPYIIFGKTNWYNGSFSMPHPEMELKPKAKQELKTGMKALYSSTEKLGNSGITNKVMTGMIQQLFLELKGEFSETLPEYLIQKEALLTKDKALLNIHFPKTTDLLARAQFRLKFEELFYIQLQLILKTSFISLK